MGKLHFAFGVLVALNLCADEVEAARIHATRQSAHSMLAVESLTADQQRMRRAAMSAEDSMVCRKPEVKGTINADTSVDGVTDINWDTVKATANDGLYQINKDIETLTMDVAELEQRIKELEEAAKWGEVADSDMDEMLHAACTEFQQEGNPTNDCSWAVEGNCGWNDPVYTEGFLMPPFEEPVAKFRTVAETKITGYRKLPITRFRDYCASVLSADMCSDLCFEFTEVVRSLVNADSAEVLGNTETLDQVRARHKKKVAKLAATKAEKDTCAAALTELDKFREQLSKLSGDYKTSKSTVGRYSRTLRMQQIRLRRQIQILEEKKELLRKAKAVFAAASQQVIERQKDVDHMQAILDNLQEELRKQMELIAVIEKKIAEIEAATETGRLLKAELSMIVAHAVDTTVQSIHKPLEHLQITPTAKIAETFDTAEEEAAPAMKSTVHAVRDYCGTKEVSDALTSPLVSLGKEKKLSYICAGQDWDDMIAEAQASVKGTAKQVVDALKEEQASVTSDGNVPDTASLKLMVTTGEPEGLRHALATFGGKGGTFVDSYLNPGWKVEVSNGEVGTIGKMLMLYQKLGEAAELMAQQWEEAQAHARVLEAKIAEALEELKKLQELLKQAIAAKEIAEDKMNEAQKVVDENEELKKMMEKQVATSEDRLKDGQRQMEEVKDSLLKEHKERAEALLQIIQELKK